MKKQKYLGTATLLLTLVFALLLAACGQNPAELLMPGPTQPPATATPEAAATPKPTPTPTPKPTPEPTPMPVGEETDWLELPVEGATAYPVIDLALYDTADAQTSVGYLPAGSCFAVEEENGTRWRLDTDAATGWVESRYCMVNLPDVIPSMVYDDTNAYASMFRSLGKEIPDVTDQALYQASAYNPRLGREEYIIPVLYPMAQHLCAVQQQALAEGYTLVVYEGYRSNAAQMQVVQGLDALAKQDPEVNAAITTQPWSKGWFIAQKISNHQRGHAVDVSLARVDAEENRICGGYAYRAVTDYTLCQMPTPMHELSPAAASLVKPVPAADPELWKVTGLAPTMTADALRLRELCVSGGFLTPLSSEWWHFNDYSVLDKTIEGKATAAFGVETCLSRAPGASE